MMWLWIGGILLAVVGVAVLVVVLFFTDYSK